MRYLNRPCLQNFFGLVTTLLVSCGCNSFDHAWQKSAQNPVPATSLEGRWSGVWVSDVNQHSDPLRCIITKKGDGTYHARFHAIYHQALSFGYTVPLKVYVETNEFKFSGQADLGWLAGGIYHYEGHADETNFFSTYSCKYDHGSFQMTRP